MEPKKKETVGKITSDNFLKTPYSDDPIEIEREINKDYDEKLFKCVAETKKVFHGDFYIEGILKKEPILFKTLHHYFVGRASCPTPNYDQSVYRYNRLSEKIDFLWVIPDRGTCFYLRDHALEVVAEEKDLLNFILSFDDGDLLKLCKKFNGEAPDSTLIIS